MLELPKGNYKIPLTSEDSEVNQWSAIPMEKKTSISPILHYKSKISQQGLNKKKNY